MQALQQVVRFVRKLEQAHKSSAPAGEASPVCGVWQVFRARRCAKEAFEVVFKCYGQKFYVN